AVCWWSCGAIRAERGLGAGHGAEVDGLVSEPGCTDRRAATDHVDRRLQLALALGIFGIAAAVEADGGADDTILEVEAEEFAAFRPAPEHDAVPARGEADVFDHVLVLTGPERADVVVGLGPTA